MSLGVFLDEFALELFGHGKSALDSVNELEIFQDIGRPLSEVFLNSFVLVLLFVLLEPVTELGILEVFLEFLDVVEFRHEQLEGRRHDCLAYFFLELVYFLFFLVIFLGSFLAIWVLISILGLSLRIDALRIIFRVGF